MNEIGISLPETSFDPFPGVLRIIERHFSLWEFVGEQEHRMAKSGRHVERAIESGRMRFQMHAPFSDLNPASIEPRLQRNSIRYLCRELKLASDAGIGLATIHPGTVSPMSSYHREKAVAASIKGLKAISRITSDYGITLTVENMPRGSWAIMHTAEEARRVCGETGLGLCFDIGHAHLSGQTQEFFGLSDLFINVHVHDNDRSRDQHLTVGDGGADFKGLVRALKGYRGNIIIEARSIESAIESRDGLRKMVFS
ncbi:MAG: sugar phosphate isomerase/epimerase [Euryarchaeota archaeon]|nr:sugar phosphate isomerase/epimerase [Euryarchaeota archaeon]